MQLGHLALLENSCDGHIPDSVRRALVALDRDEAGRHPKTSARVRTIVVRLKPKGEVECLAEALVLVYRRKGTVTRQDMIRRGFTELQLDLYGNQAVARAIQITETMERRS